MTCISCPISYPCKYSQYVCQFRRLSLRIENVWNCANFRSWRWDWCLQLQTNLTSTELLKKLCTTERKVSLKHITYYLHPNTVFAEHIQLNMSYLIWWILSVPIWTKNFFPVGSTSKSTRSRRVDTWARDTARWYWSADNLFWQLSIDHNIDV